MINPKTNHIHDWECTYRDGPNDLSDWRCKLCGERRMMVRGSDPPMQDEQDQPNYPMG